MDSYEKNIRNFIDFVKAVAVSQVILWHFEDARGLAGLTIPEIYFQLSSLDVHDTARGIVSAFSHYGYGATNLLFIASGFGLYLSFLNKRQTWKEFYMRRVLRIVPLYWVAAGFIFYFESHAISYESFVSHLLMIQIFTPDYLDFTSLWFVGVLVWFYAFFPLFTWLFSGSATKWSLVIFSFFADALAAKTLDLLGYGFQGRLPTGYLQFFIFGMLVADSLVNNKIMLSKIISLRGGIIVSAVIASSIALNHYGIIETEFATAQCFLYFVALYVPAVIAGKSGLLRRVTAFVACSSFIAFLVHHQAFKLLLTYLIRNHTLAVTSIDNLLYLESQSMLTILMIPSAVAVILFSGLAQALYDRHISGKFAGERNSHYQA